MENYLNLREEMDLRDYMPTNTKINHLSDFFYAFSDRTRLKIIILLTMKALCVGSIAKVLNINQTTVSHQLKILKSLKIVETLRTGKNIVYYIKNEKLNDLFDVSIDLI